MDETIKNLLALSGRSIAGGTFANAEKNMINAYAKIPTIRDNLAAVFSAASTLEAMDQEIIEWRDNAPEGKHLVVTMKTPDGRIMDVNGLRNRGLQAFVAEGNVQGMPCMTMGHISTLSLFFSYEETKERNPVGFQVSTTHPVTETQPGAATTE